MKVPLNPNLAIFNILFQNYFVHIEHVDIVTVNITKMLKNCGGDNDMPCKYELQTFKFNIKPYI